MCGIVGVYEYGASEGRVRPALVERMRDTMTHRGPDGEGLWITDDRRLGLGHRRLAIVDVAGGAQPMFGPAGTCIVFNGEIYNYPKLRSELEGDGARFETSCDTEVILHLYARYGSACVEHLNGMFSFALWDSAKECLFFARDPIGEKPFYWADVDGTFVFASEAKALLEHPLVPRDVNENAVEPFLANLITPSPETLFRGVFKLPAGALGHCGRAGVSVRRYAPQRPREWSPADDGDVRGRLRSLLEQSTRARLMSDVGVGVLLSGGLDSTAIVALLGEHASSVPTFTVGFPGHEIADERAEARRVAKLYGTDHHEITLSDEEALAVLPRLIAHQDEPIADPVCVPTFAVCGLARENGIKVVLAGEGADELFWGYHGYQGMIERWPRYRLALAAPRLLRRFTPALASGERRPHRKEQLEGLAEGRVRPVHFPVGMTRWQRSRILQHQLGAGWEPSPRAPGEDALSTFAFDTQEYEFDVRLPELLLMRVDRYSMANSVEARVPFLDPVLVDYVYSLPLEQKVRNGVTKFSLKNAVADIVPPEVSNRRKQGFAAPASQWFAGDHGRMLSQLVAKGAMQRYFDASRVAQIAREAARGHWWAGQVLWPIFNFALWHRHWIEGEDIEPEAILAARRSAVGIEGRQ